MAYSQAVEDFAKEIHEADRKQFPTLLKWDDTNAYNKDLYLKLAVNLIQNGWSKKQASRDTIDWADARDYVNCSGWRDKRNVNLARSFNELMDLTQAMAEWINDPECGHDYEGLLRLQKETRA